MLAMAQNFGFSTRLLTNQMDFFIDAFDMYKVNYNYLGLIRTHQTYLTLLVLSTFEDRQCLDWNIGKYKVSIARSIVVDQTLSHAAYVLDTVCLVFCVILRIT